MSASAVDLISQALKDLGILAEGQTADGQKAQDGFEALNQYRDWLQVERLIAHELVRTETDLVDGTASYTIGSGGTINIPWPEWIDHAGLILDDTATDPIEVAIEVLSPERYARWGSKTQDGQPCAIWYDQSWTAGLGRIYPLPIPDASTYRLVTYTPGVAVAAFADLSTVYTFPPGYERALRKNLALEIAPMMQASPSEWLIRQAMESKSGIKRANVRPARLQCDPAITGRTGFWDIEAGRYR